MTSENENQAVTEAVISAQPAITPNESHKFAHPSEREFAQILQFYGLKWDYEPRSFPLRWDGDRILEMLTPAPYIGLLFFFYR